MINITKDLNEAKYVTHAGNFHADDVFATVFLEKMFKDITIIRLKEYYDDESKLAYDIGGGKFDHHQSGYDKKRDNGIHYCGFGLLWQEYGLSYLKSINIPDAEITFKVFDYLLVNGIDAIDNGEYVSNSDFNIYPLASLIELFRPKFRETKDEDDCFLAAVNFARVIFDLILDDAMSKVRVIKVIEKKVPEIKNHILVLDEFIPFEFALFYLGIDKDINFVIYPSNRGGYAAHTVASKYKGFIPKIPFKKTWAGLRDNKLAQVSGLKSARFCHNNLFLFTSDALEDAIKAAQISQLIS